MSDTDDDTDFEGDDVGPAQDLSSPEAADSDPAASAEDDEETDDLDTPAKLWRRDRAPTAKARQLFKSAAQSLAKQIAEEEEDEDEGAEDEDADEEPSVETAPAEAVAAAPEPKPTTEVTPDPQLEQLRVQLAAQTAQIEQVTARMAELDAREQTLAARESAIDEEARREAYLENPSSVIVDHVKKYLGAQSIDDVKEELADLIIDLSAQLNSESPVDPEIKSRLDVKRALRYVKAQKDTNARREETASKQRQAEAAKLEEQRRAEAQKSEIQKAQDRLSKEITKEEHRKLYPWLAEEDNAGEIVFEVIEAQFKKDGTSLQWTDAAKRANDYLKQQASAFFDKRKHLLDAQPGIGKSGTAGVSASGDPTGIRRSRALTNAATATAPRTTPAPKTPEKWDPESHRKETMRKLRVAVRTAAANPK